MTIIQASTLLFEFFKKNDAYSPKKDFLKLVLVSENPEKDEAAVNLALEQYEKSEIVQKIEIKNDKIWVLSKALDTYNQNISISPALATAISDLINRYCSLTDNKSITSDPKSLSEEDIKNLYYICHYLINQSLEKKEE
jgi:hypothetical protein